jgi:hypothetical protein
LLVASVDAALISMVPLPMPVPFCTSMPLVPAVELGARLAVAFMDAILNFSRVLPEALIYVRDVCEHEVNQNTYGPLITPTIPPWQCLPCVQ